MRAGAGSGLRTKKPGDAGTSMTGGGRDGRGGLGGRVVGRAVPDRGRPGSPGNEGEEDDSGEEEKRSRAHVGIVAQGGRRGNGTAARMAADRRQDAIAGRMPAKLAAAG